MKHVILAIFAAVLSSPSASAQCVGDVAVDSRVDGGDLGVLLANWGPVTSMALSRACDFDGNGRVDGADLGALLANWGACPGPTWGTVLESQPDPTVVTDANLREAIVATGLPWRVRDYATGIEMLLIPPTTFQMGCIIGFDYYGCGSTERPVHEVTLTSAFYLGRFEVTQAQWQAQAGSNPSRFQGQPDSAIRPVEQVSWESVQGFLSATGMRLPTEAEWEYACRAGTQTPLYNNATDNHSVAPLAWYGWNSDAQTHAVAGKAPNGFGLYDMLGNVWEWVNDWWGYYAAEAQTNPIGPVDGAYRVFRGGSWLDAFYGVGSSIRSATWPNYQLDYVGFRVARNP